jgi:hypothetical protein
VLVPNLIYCDGKNVKFAAIAVEEGYNYGARLPSYSLLPRRLFFADMDWKDPNETIYLSQVHRLKPTIATVIDIETEATFNTALRWADDISTTVDKVIFIPKIDVLARLPKQINGKEVLLGYSVPTSYGKTELDISTFMDYRIHLLGGSPHGQMRLFLKYPDNIFSVDGNYHTKMVTEHRRIWTPGSNKEDPNRFWQRDSINDKEALFRASCVNIKEGWRLVVEGDTSWLRDRRFT